MSSIIATKTTASEQHHLKAVSVPVPSEFICPITLRPMHRPLASRWGHNFECSAILNWLTRSNECPLTRKPMKPSDLIPNHPLQARIQFWRTEHGNDASEADEDPSHVDPKKGSSSMCLLSCAYLSVSEEKYNEVLSRTSTFPSSSPSPTAPLRSRTENDARARRPGESRRGFLSRILTSATAELDSTE